MTKKKKETVSKKEYDRIKKTLNDEILRKDRIIEKLKIENEMLLNTALKRSDELENMRRKGSRFLDDKPIGLIEKNRKS